MTGSPVAAGGSLIAVPESKPGNLYIAALVSISFLLAGNLLYPDYLISVGLRIGPVRLSPMGLLFVLAAPSVLCYFWKQKATLKYSVVDIALITTFLFVGIRGVLAATNGNELGLVIGYIGYALLLYYGAAVIGQNKGAIRTLFIVLVSVGIIAAVYALVEFFLGRNVLFEDIIKESTLPFPGKGYHRSGSTLGHPVFLGAFLVQLAPILLFMFIRSVGSLKKVVWGVVIVDAGLALLVTYSKGAWGTAGILIVSGVVWIIWHRSAAARPVALLLLALTITIAGFTLIFYETVNSGTRSKARTSESIAPRIYMWSRVPVTFKENPLVGAGMWQGNEEVIRVSEAPDVRYRPLSIDNIYLTFLVEQGIIGVLLASATLILIGIQAWKLLWNGRTRVELGLPITAVLLLTLINGLTFDSLMVWPNMVIFWLCAGMLRALTEMSHEPPGLRNPRVARI